MRASVTAIALALLCGLASIARAQAPTADHAKLIAQLGDEKYDVREAAEAALLRIGDPAIPAVESALTHDDAEVRHRAKRLARRLGVVLPEALDALRDDVLGLLAEPNADRRRSLLMVRARIARFAGDYPLSYPGPPRVLRSSDGKFVVAIGRSPDPDAEPIAEAEAKKTQPTVRVEDDQADLVIAVGVNGQAGRPRGQGGGTAKAFASKGLAIALGGAGGAAWAERIKGGFKVSGRGAGGKAGAMSKVPGIEFQGQQAGMFKPGGQPLGAAPPARAPAVTDAVWGEIQAFAAQARRR